MFLIWLQENNESKILTKDLSCSRKCKFGERKCNLYQWWNNKKCQCDCKKHHTCEKDSVWNPVSCSCENRQHLANITDDSVIKYDEIIEETKTIATNFNEKNSLQNTKLICFTCIFINYYRITDSRQYSLLSDKM